MRATLFTRAFAVAVCAAATLAGTPSASASGPATADRAAAAAQKPKRVKMRRWVPAGLTLRHLRLREGRTLYRGPRTLRYRWPYLVAATPAERDDNVGLLVEFHTAHEIFEPIRDPDQALEAVRIFSDGMPIADRAMWNDVVKIVKAFDPKGGWEAKVAKEGVPAVFGTQLEKHDTGLAVRTLRFTCAGYAALCVVAVDYGFPLAGPFQKKVEHWVTGPPQAWQTSGDVDQNHEAKLYATIQKLRRDVLRCLSKYRQIHEVENVLAKTSSFAQACFLLGPPDGQIGSGLRIYRFSIGDGSVVDVVVGKNDRIARASHSRGGSDEKGRDVRALRIAKN